jgi:hypothetical protein
MSEGHVEEMFELVWPGLERDISDLPSEDEPAAPERSDGELLNEILELVRSLNRSDSAERIDDWGSALTVIAMEVANSLGLGVKSAGLMDTGDGTYRIQLHGTDGIYQVLVPSRTPVSMFRTFCLAQLAGPAKSLVDKELLTRKIPPEGSSSTEGKALPTK